MNPLYEFEDIEDYLQDRMSISDRAAFEQALETDTDLVHRVEALRAESKVLRMLRNEHLLTQLDDWSKEGQTPEKKIPPSFGAPFLFSWTFWVILAVFGLGLAGLMLKLGWFQQAQSHQSQTPYQAPVQQIAPPGPIAQETPAPQDQLIPTPTRNPAYDALAANSYVQEDFAQTLMGTDEDNSDLRYDQAVKLYGAKKYQQALKLLEKPEKGRASEFLYLRGYTYYQMGQYVRAAATFHAFRTMNGSDRQLDAVWCEVFSLAKQLPGSRTHLDSVLKEITANPQHPYYDKAKAMQESLAKIH